MKLKSNFITHLMGEKQILIDVAGKNFSGLVRSNKTAAFIVDQLKSETTKEAIINAMLKKYDAPREVIEEDADIVIKKLQSIGALDE